ncbi:MAG: DUF6055 domain-containing protein [Akkermansiaceae bacterium]|jgi:autotransporter-associated beta strand protein|nr:DUF6055 domain-containing protein [Akkermansiaceae bacterium]
MKPIILWLALGLLARGVDLPIVVDPTTPLTGTFAVEWNNSGDLESWTTSQINSVTVGGGLLSGTTSNTSPQIIRTNFPGPDLDLGFNDHLELRIQVPASHTGDIRISYGTTATTGFSNARVLVIPDALIPTDGAFHTYRIDVGPEPWWRANLRDLRIEPSSTSGQAFAIDYLRVGDLPNDVYLTNPEFSSDNEMSSKRFRFLWSTARAAQGVNATVARGALRNAEEAWQVYTKVMGYCEPAESTSSPNGNKYKVNFLCIYDGYWMSSTAGGFAYMNIEPGGLQVDPPSWIIPHELMHVFQHHNNNGHYSGQWETHANYGRARWLKHYQNLYPNSAGIEALGVRDGHFMISSGRNYYLTWPFLYYVDDNPDNLPDLSDGMIKRLWQEGQPGEFWATTLDRLTPSTSLKDISGYYARRCATWDFSNQAAMNADLNAQDPIRNARHLFTDLIQRLDAPGWWRVPPNKAPAQGAYAMHELIPAGSGAGRVVTVNLQGLTDAARGADWRASFIAVSDTGVERYTPLWNSGSSSITLAANENKLYLSVAGTPDWYANGGFDEAAEPFRSHPSRSRFHYQVQVTGATPRERNNGATTGLTRHSNGGGWRSVSVPNSVFIGPNARVTGGAVSGNARIEDYAVVSGGTVNSNAVIGGHAWVRGGTVTGNARVRDWAIVDGGTISGNARVLEHATVEGNMQGTAVAKGSAWHQSGGTLSGNAIVDGDYMGNKSISGGITFGHLPFVGIPDNFTTATPAGHYASYDFSSAHDSRALDRFGVTDAFTLGSPAWSSTDWKRKGFLSFNGSNQYLALDRSVADSRAFTFAAWVKPTGGAANQAILWLGASPTKRLALTANDGNGLTRFSIVNGGAEQFLTSAALPTGVWSHVAVALDGSNGTLFVNGSSVATGAITLTPDQLLAPNTTTGTQHNYLARSEGTAMPMFQGSIDDAQFYSSALNATQLAAVTVPLAGDVLVSDNFNSASYGAGAFNSTLSADQQGLLAPLTYTVSAPGGDWSTQHGNGGAMLIANAGNNNWVSPNFDFSTVANSLNRPIVIEFDAWVTATTNPDAWLGFGIDTAQGTYVEDQKYSSLARLSAGTRTYKFVFSDAPGTGSAFNGVTDGARVQLFIDDILQGTTTTTLGPGDGYITFQQDRWSGYSIGLVDNFSVSVVSATTFAVIYNGNTNSGGSVPIDSANPYAANSSVTVLGNTGSLVKTGYSFANWNTAADGSGTSYNPGATFSIAAPVTLFAQWSPGPDFIWNNSASNNIWSTIDANWLGAPWVNSSSNNAWFQATGGAITLASGLAAGAVNVGNVSANFPATSFSGGSLTAAGLTVQGLGSNHGDYAANPTLTLNSTIALTGDAAIGRGNLVVAGGTLTANRIISNSASADWGRLAISGGTVTAINGVDGSVNTAATFQLELNGGTLETSSLRIANRDLNTAGPGGNNDAHLILNGGTLKAIGSDNANFISVYGDTANAPNPDQAAYVQAGGAIIDTNGRNIGIPVKLLAASGSGGLTKNGNGVLTLSASNTYTGPTTVQAGTLRLGNGTNHSNLADSADLILATGASLHLDYIGTDIIDELSVAGIAKSPGIYSSSNSPFITGPGTLTVLSGPPSDYDQWKSSNNVSGGPEADDDHDGLSNFAEYAFGLAPDQGSSVQVILTPLDRATGSFSYQRRKPSLTGLTYRVWTSTNLSDWTEDTTASQTATDIPNSDHQSVVVFLTSALETPERLFIRVQAE